MWGGVARSSSVSLQQVSCVNVNFDFSHKHNDNTAFLTFPWSSHTLCVCPALSGLCLWRSPDPPRLSGSQDYSAGWRVSSQVSLPASTVCVLLTTHLCLVIFNLLFPLSSPFLCCLLVSQCSRAVHLLASISFFSLSLSWYPGLSLLSVRFVISTTKGDFMSDDCLQRHNTNIQSVRSTKQR